jgi:hypothetical protein
MENPYRTNDPAELQEIAGRLHREKASLEELFRALSKQHDKLLASTRGWTAFWTAIAVALISFFGWMIYHGIYPTYTNECYVVEHEAEEELVFSTKAGGLRMTLRKLGSIEYELVYRMEWAHDRTITHTRDKTELPVLAKHHNCKLR